MGTNQHIQHVLPVESAGPTPRCVDCGYDLRGLPIEGRCPECNTPITLSLKETAQRVCKPEKPVQAESGTWCVRCGASLGGRGSHGECPKCGAPVWLSLHGDWLCVRHPAWLRRVRRAMTLWIWALLITVVLNVVRSVTPWIWSFLWDRGYFATGYFRYEGIAAQLVGLVATLLAWVAAFVLTSVNPATIVSEPRWTLRRLIRMLVPAVITLWALRKSMFYLPVEVPESFDFASTLLYTFADAAVDLGLIAYLRDLCHRLPDRKLERRLVIVFWGFAAFRVSYFCWTCAALVLSGLGYEAVRAAGWLLRNTYFYGIYVSLILFLVFSVWLVIILRRFRRELREMIVVPV